MAVSLGRDDGVGKAGSGTTVPPDLKTMACWANPELLGSLSCRDGLIACRLPCSVTILGERRTCPGSPKTLSERPLPMHWDPALETHIGLV